MTTTGDPTIDSLIAWLTSGGTLAAPGAALALAFLVHSVLMPILERLIVKYNWTVSAIMKIQAVYAMAFVLVAIVGYATKSVKTFPEAVAMTIMVANIAQGIHSTKSVTQDAATASLQAGNS